MARHSAGSMELAALSDNVDPMVRRVISEGIKQFLAAKETRTFVEKAMAKLNKEWEG